MSQGGLLLQGEAQKLFFKLTQFGFCPKMKKTGEKKSLDY